MAELFVFVIAIALGSTAVAAGVFWGLWVSLGRYWPFLTGAICFLLGSGALLAAAVTNWFGFGQLGLGLLPLGVLLGPAILGVLFMVKGARERAQVSTSHKGSIGNHPQGLV